MKLLTKREKKRLKQKREQERKRKDEKELRETTFTKTFRFYTDISIYKVVCEVSYEAEFMHTAVRFYYSLISAYYLLTL